MIKLNLDRPQAQGGQISFSGRLLAAADVKTAANYGWRWDVQIIEAGEDKQGSVTYPLAVLHAVAPLYEDAPIFALSTSQHNDGRSQFGNSVRDLVGRVKNVTPNGIGPQKDGSAFEAYSKPVA